VAGSAGVPQFRETVEGELSEDEGFRAAGRVQRSSPLDRPGRGPAQL
ncbi:MAG: hypothetical protein AVDCRST_MAG41-750, partial [uncultured Corynebacteriales bacterium]